MQYRSPLTPDEHEAYLSMPRTADGFVISLFFVPRGERDALEEAWREWARGRQKHLHPTWFADWAEFKRSGIAPNYAAGVSAVVTFTLAKLKPRRRATRPQQDKSAGLVFQLKALNFASRYTMETQYRFHHTRRWTFDVAFPHLRLGIEVDGGLYVRGGGGHTRGKAREDDMEKDAEAMILGWRVLRVSPTHVRTGVAVQWIDRILTEHL